MAEADFELEAKSKEDSSWHPCQVLFSSAASGLTVDFGSRVEGDVIYSEEEALARLRFRSSPLRGDDCSRIKQGDRVLASLKTQSKSLFFDCEVEKVSQRHTKKIYCRCTFQIKRLCSDSRDGSVSVTSNAIMKISTTKISHHPAVAAFLTSFRTLTCSNVSSLATGPVSETDIPIMLEKQIEDIFKSVHAPREGFIEAKGCLPRAILEKSNRAYLSPLGARAALASFMQEQPIYSEVPICHVENEKVSVDNTPSMEGTSNKKRAAKKTSQTVGSANLLATQKRPIQTLNEPKAEKLNIACSGIHLKSSASGKNVNRPMGTTRSTRSTVQKEMQNSTPTGGTKQTLDERPEDKKSDTACVEKRIRKSATGNNVNCPMEANRSTHPTFQKEIRNLNTDVELKTPTEDTHTSPSHMTGLTRSVSPKGGSVKSNKGLEESKQAEGASLGPKKRDQVSAFDKQTKMKRPLSSPVEPDVQSSQSRESSKKQRVTDKSRNIARKGGVSDSKGRSELDSRFSPRLKLLSPTRYQKK